MAYSELVKRFDLVRDYMRDFLIFGFKTREDFDLKKRPHLRQRAAADRKLAGRQPALGISRRRQSALFIPGRRDSVPQYPIPGLAIQKLHR